MVSEQIMESNDLSLEPMDIDLSSQSVKDMDISFNNSDIEPQTIRRFPSPPEQLCRRVTASPNKQSTIKKYHINIQKAPRSSNYKLLKILVAVIIVFVSLIAYNIHNLKCCDHIDLEKLHETLSNNLYGQSVAVNTLIKTLELNSRSKILIFFGGTGVGKTFTSSLLLDTVGTCSNVYHYTMPTFENTFSTELMFGLTMCKKSLFIVDDLTMNNVDIMINIKTVIEKSENLGKEIIVILIYNCNEDHKSFNRRCDESLNIKLLDVFSDIRAFKTLIKFEPLKEKHLKECIKQELGNRKLSDIELENVLKKFNVSIDGCKGVHSKMKYLNIV